MTEIRKSLVELDVELSRLQPCRSGVMLALPVSIASDNRILRGFDNEACVLIPSAEPAIWPDLKLRHVKAQTHVRCEIQGPDGMVISLYGTLIICTTVDPQLRRMFLLLMDEALAALGESPDALLLAKWLQRIATLFSQLEQEGRKNLRGLWAELLLISAIGDPSLLVRRWHANPMDTFDFTSGAFAIEVKSCADLDRVHHFSLSQLRPPMELNVWLASICLQVDRHGVSVLDLLWQIEKSIVDINIRQDLRLMVFAIGGQALEEDNFHRFDQVAATRSLIFFDIKDIPKIEQELPAEIVGVKLEIRCRDIPRSGSVEEVRDRLVQGA